MTNHVFIIFFLWSLGPCLSLCILIKSIKLTKVVFLCYFLSTILSVSVITISKTNKVMRFTCFSRKPTDSYYQWVLQLNFLSAIRHENLVPLLGSCCENDQQILVYPFMSNGSLQDRLYGTPYVHLKFFKCMFLSARHLSFTKSSTGEAAKRKTLDWPTRLSIALGAARGK